MSDAGPSPIAPRVPGVTKQSITTSPIDWRRSIYGLLKSPIARKVALLVFAAILLVELVILIPSTFRKQDELQENLRNIGENLILAAFQTLDDKKNYTNYAKTILNGALVTGILIVDKDDKVVTAFGESIKSEPYANARGWHPSAPDLSEKADRLELVWGPDATRIPHTVVLRLDSSSIANNLASFILRVLGLILILSTSMTAASMLAVGWVVLRPLVAFRDALIESTESGREGLGTSISQRRDEIGDVSRVTDNLLHQIFDARHDLEAQVEARTNELQQSEERFRGFASASSDYLWETDAGHLFTYFSDRFAEVTQLDPNNILGRKFGATTHLEQSHSDWDEVLADMDAHRPVRNFLVMRGLQDGTMSYRSFSANPYYDEAKNFKGYRGTATNITSLKAAEEALRESEMRFRDFAASSSDYFWEIDSNLRFTYFSERFSEVTGAPVDETLGQTFEEFQGRDIDPEGWARFIEALQTHGPFRNLAIARRLTDGTIGHRALSGNPVYDDNGAFIGYRGTGTDITAAKQAEDELAQQRALLQTTLENTDQGIVMYDAQLRLVAYNQTFAILRGFDEEYLATKPTLYEMSRRQAAAGQYPGLLGDADAQAEHWVALIEEAETVDVVEQTRADGTIHEVRTRRLSDGGYVRVFIDITERKQAEEFMKTARDEAEANAEAKSEFVAMVSHEVRTPMNGVMGMARLLTDGMLDTDQRECVETIIASGESLLRIVDDLLDISKLEADRLELEEIPFILTDVTEQAVAVMASRSVENSLDLRCKLDPTIPPIVVGDPHRLRQVLLNLIGNAIKFTDQGTITVRVDVESRTDTSVVLQFAVVDTGKGISPDIQEKLFTPYTQGAVEVARKYGGTGLGLTICRRLVELMGGEVGLESAVNQGSTFHFNITLPIDRITDAETLRDVEIPHRKVNGVEEDEYKPLQILQVEDNAINRRVVERIVRRAGHTVTNAVNGVEGLAALTENNFDIILMDRHMPEMNGIDATIQIRQMAEPLRSIPIIGITAGAIESELNACVDAGMDTCLTKPVNGRELLDTIQRLSTGSGIMRTLTSDHPILVIDDMQINLMVASKQLERIGLTCEICNDSPRALSLAKSKTYSAILVDIAMPRLDGMSFTQEVRDWERQQGGHVPIIAMTGYATAEDRKKFSDAGMNDNLAKPVKIDELADTLGRWLTQGSPSSRQRDAEVSSPDLQSDPPVDLSQLAEILGDDDPAGLVDLIDMFIEYFPSLITPISDAVKAKDAAALSDTAHAAKGAARNAAATVLATDLQELESGASAGEWSQLQDIFDRLEPEFERLVAFNHEQRAAG